jgi:hypothetical protein
MAVSLSALRADRTLPAGRFLVLISVRGLSVAGRIRSIEKYNELIGNRTRDLPACSIVPQPHHRMTQNKIKHVIDHNRV